MPWACAIQAWAARTWLDLPRPVALIRPLRARSDLDQLDNIGLCSGDITAARRARCAGEVGDGFFRPVLAYKMCPKIVVAGDEVWIEHNGAA